MNAHRGVGLALGVLTIIVMFGQAQPAPDESAQPPGVDVQARGPVHEAFAEPISDQPKQGTGVTKEPPPPTVEAGPSVPAPDPSSTYVGGCWIYAGANYRWRPGHWIAYRPGWVWIPAHYIWTPVGCVFVDGYWDYPLDARGLLFAPVRF